MSKTPPAIFAVVLAAGAASRFGSSKQLARLDGETLVHRAARIARECCANRSLLIAGHDASAVIDSAGGQCRFVAVNDHYRDGLSSSLSLAARVLGNVADGILLILADQPCVTAAHLRSLMAHWTGARDEVVATACGSVKGAPALLPAGLYPDLASLTGDRGARALFDHPAFAVSSVRFDGAAVDIDVPADLAALEDRDSGG